MLLISRVNLELEWKIFSYMRNFALSPDILLPEQKLVLKLSVLTEHSVALIKIGNKLCAFLNTIASKKDGSRSNENDQH